MILIDNFIKDQSLLDEIKNDKNFFINPKNQRMWWDGWWNSPADTLKKRIIELIWKENPLAQTPEIQKKINDGAGFEYLTSKYGPDEDRQSLENCTTHDDIAWDENQIFTPPMWGCIYYPIDYPVNGGYLSLEPTLNHHEVLRPKYNRLIMFSTGEVSQTINEVYGGVLHQLNINLYYEEIEAFKQGLTLKDK